MKYLLAFIFFLLPFACYSGVDLTSKISRVKLNGDGNLWIKMESDSFDEYCKPGWFGFNLYIPESDKYFPYYYGLLTSALASGQNVYIANISKYDGSTACDLTKTGYGVVVLKTK